VRPEANARRPLATIRRSGIGSGDMRDQVGIKAFEVAEVDFD
jgi:hypothetical protein